jgi:hypothetical protein
MSRENGGEAAFGSDQERRRFPGWVAAVFNRFGVLGGIFGLDERTAWELERRRDDGGGGRVATILEWTEEDVAMKRFA